MADKTKYIYGKQFAQKLPGSNQNFYFRTATSYEVDGNGKPIEGTSRTNLYYAPKPAARTSDGKTWTPGTADSTDNFDQGGWVNGGYTNNNGKTYTFFNYTQKDADLGRIPPGKKVGDEVLGATAQQSLTTSGGRFYEAVQNNLINLAVNTQPGLAKVVSAKQANVAAAEESSRTPADPVPNDPVNIEEPGITAVGARDSYDNYYYPKTLRGNQNKQDIIKFTAFSYGSRNLTVQGSTKDSFGTPGLGERTFGEIKGSVTLPIQPSITDTNTVEWGGENLNPLQAFGAAVSYGAQTDIAGAAQQLGNQTEKLFRDSNFKNAARIFLAGKAVGVNGLLSRIGGAVLNPNMELLFQGPQLRPFSFTFRLSPRDRDEAKQVKYIIRFFKQNMSIKNTADNIFLKAPNIFEIKYINGVTGNDHTSLNRIKRCALQSCSVDYTPDGSYMTFNDPDSGHPMTSYNLTLQFQELEPVTEKDYNDLNDINAIGY